MHAAAAHEEQRRIILEAQKRYHEKKEQDDLSGDVVFALFLEPHASEDAHVAPSLFDRALSFAVANLQPSPVMAHVELVVPPPPTTDGPINFATYIGARSGWNVDTKSNHQYYLSVTAGKWRAVPVFGTHAARLVREACDESCDVPYSLFRYVTATRPVRFFADMVPDGPRSPAHCATLTARVLRRALGAALDHRGAYYGPATLYAELCRDLAERNIAPDSTSVGAATQQGVTTLLQGTIPDVAHMTDAMMLPAIRALTLKAAAAEGAGDSAAQRITQKQLATALLKWSLVKTSRAEESVGATRKTW